MIFINNEAHYYDDMIDNGIHDVIEYKTNEKGENIKVIKKIHKYTLIKKQPTSVIERRTQWKKFGKALEKDNSKCTYLSPEEVFMEPPPKPSTSPIIAPNDVPFNTNSVKSDDAVGISVKCTKCGGKHWTRFCNNDKNESPKKEKEKETKPRYEPPSIVNVDKSTTVLITNLSKEAKEYDLFDLIMTKDNTIRISKLSIPKDYNSTNSKGIAFVMTKSKKHAEKLISILHNVGFDNLMLKASFVKE